MERTEFDEGEFFRLLGASGVRVLLIGRRALVAYGLPVLTADYDLWLHADDVQALNEALRPFGLLPDRSAEDARGRGRYVLENDEHVDVMVARVASTKDGVRVHFDEVWTRRRTLQYDERTTIAVPCIDDLILTKRWGMRDRDVADIRLLEALRLRLGEKP